MLFVCYSVTIDNPKDIYNSTRTMVNDAFIKRYQKYSERLMYTGCWILGTTYYNHELTHNN